MTHAEFYITKTTFARLYFYNSWESWIPQFHGYGSQSNSLATMSMYQCPAVPFPKRKVPMVTLTLVASLIRSFLIVQSLTTPSTVLSSFSQFVYGATSMKNDRQCTLQQ